ncbi:MAG: ZIP family metal transporter [Marinilabiliaceae bacterium]
MNIFIALLIPVIGTTLGSAFVFFMHGEMNRLTEKALLGFAAGVMIAAGIWSLLLPSMEMSGEGAMRVVPAATGFAIGMAFLLCVDTFTPHQHISSATPEGPHSALSKSQMLALAVTIHNIPEGMAVGVVIASMLTQGIEPTLSGALAVSLGIAIQNIPEGAIISMPMRAAGNSRRKSFAIGTLSGLVEPVGAMAVILLAEVLTGVLPYLLGFAAGAMTYVVVEELIPAASAGRHSNISVIGFGVGFLLMMVMDSVL